MFQVNKTSQAAWNESKEIGNSLDQITNNNKSPITNGGQDTAGDRKQREDSKKGHNASIEEQDA